MRILLKDLPPGPEWLRIAIEHLFVDTIPAQHSGLQRVLRDFPADVIVGDDMFFGVLPMLLRARAGRPPIALCGTSFLYCRREDGAPHFLGLAPATTQTQLKEYAAIAREHDKLVDRPVSRRLNRRLEDLGVGPLSLSLLDSVVELADAYMQLTVPSSSSLEIYQRPFISLAHCPSFQTKPRSRPGPMSWTARARSSLPRRGRWQITISAS